MIATKITSLKFSKNQTRRFVSPAGPKFALKLPDTEEYFGTYVEVGLPEQIRQEKLITEIGLKINTPYDKMFLVHYKKLIWPATTDPVKFFDGSYQQLSNRAGATLLTISLVGAPLLYYFTSPFWTTVISVPLFVFKVVDYQTEAKDLFFSKQSLFNGFKVLEEKYHTK